MYVYRLKYYVTLWSVEGVIGRGIWSIRCSLPIKEEVTFYSIMILSCDLVGWCGSFSQGSRLAFRDAMFTSF